MYKKHFGLNLEPFSLTPDPAFLFPSADHAEALAGLRLGLKLRRGFIVMTGEVGTGKTTLLYSLLQRLDPRMHTAYISNTRLPFSEILRTALKDFGVSCQSKKKATLVLALSNFLLRCAQDGVTATLVVDEAQNLTSDTFEDLRLLSNVETYKSKPLQIVLVGQPELDAKLNSPSLRQVAERVAVQLSLRPLTPKQSRHYIEHRLRVAGGSPDIFTQPALRLAAMKSTGIPRRINIICHNALLFAYGRGLSRVNRSVVRASLQGSTSGRRTLTKGLGGGRLQYVWRSLGSRWPWGPVGAAAGIAAAVMVFASPLPWSGWIATRGPSVTQVTKAPRNALAGESYQVAAIPEKGKERNLVSTSSRSLTTALSSSHRPRAAKTMSTSSVNRAKGRPANSQRVEEGPAEPTSANGLRNLAAAKQQPQAVSHDAGDPYLVKVKPGQTLYALIRSIYGTYAQRLLRAVQRENPQIVDPNRILAGDNLRFPRYDPQPTAEAKQGHSSKGGKL